MCSKSLIILLIGCALALANPIQGNGNLSPQQGNNFNIGYWLSNQHYGIRLRFKHTVKPFTLLYDALVEAINVPGYSKEKIEELRTLFHEIIDKSRENLSDIENAIFTNTIVNLQKAAEFLSRRLNQNIQPSQQVPPKGNQNLQEFINNQANNAKNVGNTVWSGFSGVGQKVEGMVNSQVENVKDSGFYLKPEKVTITDKLGEGVHKVDKNEVENTKKEENESTKKATVDTVQKAVDGAVENVKKNLDDWRNNFNEWGNKGDEIAQGFKNIGNKAQDTFGNGFNGMQNQFNQYIPGNNNIGGRYKGYGNAFNSREVFNNVGKQLSQAIAIKMNEIEQSLYEWKNLVKSFLLNSKSNLEQQSQELHEDLNVLGNIGYKPSIDKDIEVPKNPIKGLFGNIAKKIGEQVGNKVEQFTSMLKMNEEKKDKKDSVDGIFSKIGQHVGKNMGSGVDKFTGAVGGFFNNAGKFLGL